MEASGQGQGHLTCIHFYVPLSGSWRPHPMAGLEYRVIPLTLSHHDSSHPDATMPSVPGDFPFSVCAVPSDLVHLPAILERAFLSASFPL